MGKILGRKFFNRLTLRVAQELLGKYLVRRIGKRAIARMITEVEAYIGPEDRASHAWRGYRKARHDKMMFAEPGLWFVYLTYGMHWMLNVVTERKGYPATVLIRGVRGVYGPGRLTKFFRITKRFNDQPVNRRTGLWIEDRGVKVPASHINRGKRIGVDYAGPWRGKPWRFFLSSQSSQTFLSTDDREHRGTFAPATNEF